jgi:hypothetical protein
MPLMCMPLILSVLQFQQWHSSLCSVSVPICMAVNLCDSPVSHVSNCASRAGTGSSTCERHIFNILGGCLVTNILSKIYKTGSVILK